MSTPYLDLGRIYGDSAFEAWCKRQDPVLDSTLTASWLAFLAAIKGETGATGAPGADGLTEGEVDARVVAGITGKQDTLAWDDAPVESSINPVKSGGIFTALSGKQDTLEWDSTPTADSTKPVTSGGVHAAIAAADIGDTGWVAMTMNSNVVSSGVIYYRVKNGVVFFSGSFVAKPQSPSKPLTTSSLPEGITTGDKYNAYPILPADCGVWYLPHVWFHRSERRPYLGGIIYLGDGSVVSLNTSISINFRGDSSFVIG